jgi:hypothetical protein
MFFPVGADDCRRGGRFEAVFQTAEVAAEYLMERAQRKG